MEKFTKTCSQKSQIQDLLNDKINNYTVNIEESSYSEKIHIYMLKRV